MPLVETVHYLMLPVVSMLSPECRRQRRLGASAAREEDHGLRGVYSRPRSRQAKRRRARRRIGDGAALARASGTRDKPAGDPARPKKQPDPDSPCQEIGIVRDRYCVPRTEGDGWRARFSVSIRG